MIVRDIHRIIEGWAPKEIAWERDNIGLQVGSMDAKVKGVLACLDVTEDILAEAQRQHSNLVISHHPLLFKPLRSVDLDSATGRCVDKLLRSKTSLYSAHTNLDFARWGTSFSLAERLGLTDVDFLLKNYRLEKKIVTFVPPDHVEAVSSAMGKAGAGTIGNYDFCSFRTQGTGTFMGNPDSNPTVGQKGNLEKSQETRLEMVVEHSKLDRVVNALISAHPYEEVAYDVYSLENLSADYGMGIIGQLPEAMTLSQFINHVKKALPTKGVRYSRGARNRIRRVAACGGSGSDLTEVAIREGADAFVTADVKYHGFHDASGRLVLVDAGHYETEHPVINTIVNRLRREFKQCGVNISVNAAMVSSNPIAYN